MVFLIFIIIIYKVIKNKSILTKTLVDFQNNQRHLINTIYKQKIYIVFIVPMSLVFFFIILPTHNL